MDAKPLYTLGEIRYARGLARKLKKKSLKAIRGYLLRLGFTEYGEGVYKKAYRSNKFPKLLFKVYHYYDGHEYDSGTKGLPKKFRHRFLTPLIHNRKFIVQRLANGKGFRILDADEVVRRDIGNGLFDIAGNCAFHDGKAYFFDYCT